uniref:Aminoglycoside N(6')-acetyltransferase type 1 n=1 Tax=Acinetobacter pittii TaxID=48296 RepID=Q75ZP9_ACIPI|nr:aminoglycoside N-acetyltransferase AAC(6')-Iad [Acinetobacter pittii]BAD12078.1 aminoglycoside 6'-N-acetyltransferase [Acinetobacter pittii]
MIRKATVQDPPLLARLAMNVWKESSLKELVAEFEQMTKSNDAVAFILFIEDQAVGFAQCQLRHDYVEGTNTSPVGYLEGIFVEKEFRHRGYASELLLKCEDWVKTKGCLQFASDCELDNIDSLAFHLKVGFTEANRMICFTKQL